jgi:hypothetical protein
MLKSSKLSIEEMVRRYNAGEIISAIAQAAGLSNEPVRRNLIEAGVVLRHRGRQNVYDLNEDYFAEIDTEEKAYWLGFSLADGCVDYSRGYVRYSLGLAPSEFDHVVKFRNAIGSSAPVELNARTARLMLSRPRFCSHLIRHGCEPGKTATHGLPAIPQHLYKHLFRGAFDGDGSIFEQGLTCKLADGSDCRYKQWRASFVGSQLFVTEFQAWVQRETGVAPKTLEHCGRVVEFRYGSTRQTAVFLSASCLIVAPFSYAATSTASATGSSTFSSTQAMTC